MAMQLGVGSGGRTGLDGEEYLEPSIVAEINITPLTDIFLVLLIIFMVTSSVLSQMNVQVQLPQSTNAASSNQTPGVIVTVTSASQIFVNGVAISEQQLGQALKTVLAKSPDKTVILEGDRQAVLGTIVKVMDEGKKAGALKFAISTKGGSE
ncbi:MAG: biopolymer transporter ExbD [Bdellovibrionota bacterium]